MERKIPTGAFANSIATPPPNPSRDQALGTSFVEAPGPWYHLAKKEPTD